jgi:uncharacterized cupredoxin-like copper-binding protein
MMLKSVLWLTLASCAASAGLATAQPGDARSGQNRIDVKVYSYGFTPQTITLQHGQPYQLHFANASKGDHDFTAKAFFSAAQVTGADARKIDDGKVKLDGGETADVSLVAPAPGTYEFHCSHFFHAAKGMKGQIVVR